METLKRFKLPIVVVILHLIMVVYFNSVLPDDVMIPRQWNFRGEIGSESGKAFGLWFMWGINAFLLLVFMLFPYIDPRYRKNRQRFDRLLPNLVLLMTISLTIIHLYMLLWALEVQIVREVNGMLFIVGFLFILLGNILPIIPSNFYAGFRSPWTLSSDTVWKKTHRYGGYCFVVSGMLMILRGLFSDLSSALSSVHLIVVFTVCLSPFIYSYYLYSKERKNEVDNKAESS